MNLLLLKTELLVKTKVTSPGPQSPFSHAIPMPLSNQNWHIWGNTFFVFQSMCLWLPDEMPVSISTNHFSVTMRPCTVQSFTAPSETHGLLPSPQPCFIVGAQAFRMKHLSAISTMRTDYCFSFNELFKKQGKGRVCIWNREVLWRQNGWEMQGHPRKSHRQWVKPDGPFFIL